LKWPKNRALRAKEAQRVLDTTPHSPDRELSSSTLSEAFALADGGILLLFEDGKGRLYESRDELRAMLEQVEQRALQGPASPCRDLPQGRAFAEQVAQLVLRLPALLKMDASQLDGTKASLDNVDKALWRMSPQRMLDPGVFAALTAYVGEVIRNVTKGHWEMRRASDSEKTWEAWIVDPSGHGYAPFKIYKELLEYGRSASLRVFVQSELGHGMTPTRETGATRHAIRAKSIKC
jgi:hypothetical protein